MTARMMLLCIDYQCTLYSGYRYILLSEHCTVLCTMSPTNHHCRCMYVLCMQYQCGEVCCAIFVFGLVSRASE